MSQKVCFFGAFIPLAVILQCLGSSFKVFARAMQAWNLIELNT